MSFVTEFRKNIPYIADEIANAIGGGSDSWTIEEVYDKAEQVLTDWLNEYQTEEAQSKEEQ